MSCGSPTDQICQVCITCIKQNNGYANTSKKKPNCVLVASFFGCFIILCFSFKNLSRHENCRQIKTAQVKHSTRGKEAVVAAKRIMRTNASHPFFYVTFLSKLQMLFRVTRKWLLVPSRHKVLHFIRPAIKRKFHSRMVLVLSSNDISAFVCIAPNGSDP